MLDGVHWIVPPDSFGEPIGDQPFVGTDVYLSGSTDGSVQFAHTCVRQRASHVQGFAVALSPFSAAEDFSVFSQASKSHVVVSAFWHISYARLIQQEEQMESHLRFSILFSGSFIDLR